MNISTHTQVSPANDANASKNDALHDELKGGEIIDQEIELITNLNPEAKTILDIGCGTGRHVIPLAELGYEVTGIDLSEGMLEVLKTKIKGLDTILTSSESLDLTQTDSRLLSPVSLSEKVRVIYGDILTHEFDNTFDLIILMWNALNEIAMSEAALRLFFQKITKLMHDESRVVINIDDLENIDLENIDHKLVNVLDGFKYESDWKVEQFDKENNITHSRETISKFDMNGNLIDKSSEIMIQKWWKRDEIEKVGGEFEISFEMKNIEGNEELYLVGSKQ